jgi:HME family heavy-metal exporter
MVLVVIYIEFEWEMGHPDSSGSSSCAGSTGDGDGEYGLSREYVAEFVQTALQGDVVSQVLDGARRFDLVVRLREEEPTEYFSLRDLRLDLPDDRGQINLEDVADFTDGTTGPNQLMRENVRRRIVVRCNRQDRDLGSVVADIESQINSRVRMPEGYYVEIGGSLRASDPPH